MSNKKQLHIQTPSLSTFAHNTQTTQTTKKTISNEQISMQVNSQSSHHTTLSSFNLQAISSYHNIIVPFQINIKSLIKHLLMKLEQRGIIILHSDEQEGEILIQKKVYKTCWTSLLDCLCLCKKEGWAKGSITQSFEAVSILIKRQYVQYRCRVKVRANTPKDKASPQLLAFIQEIVDFIRKCLQNFKDVQDQYQSFQISAQSPLAMQISANEQAYNLFIQDQHADKRFKTLFNTSLQKIRNEIVHYRQQNGIQRKSKHKINLKQEQQNKQKQENLQDSAKGLNSSQSLNKNAKRKMKISQIMELIINQTGNIYEFCRQLNKIHAPSFHPDYALYSIEGLFCYFLFPELFQLYKRDIVKQCQEFYHNSQYINKNLTSKQYFDYLQVRPKYRLQSSQQPYDLAIHALRQLQTSLTLRQILLCMQKTFSLIKVCCLYQHDGKLDLTSMDDILPVMIYVVARAQVVDFPVYVKIIDDYIKIRGVFELQERVTTTLFVATQDIAKKLPKIGKD